MQFGKKHFTIILFTLLGLNMVNLSVTTYNAVSCTSNETTNIIVSMITITAVAVLTIVLAHYLPDDMSPCMKRHLSPDHSQAECDPEPNMIR